MKKASQTAWYKASRSKHKKSDRFKQTNKAWKDRTGLHLVHKKKYVASEKGVAKRKERGREPMVLLSHSLFLMLKEQHGCPTTFPKMGIFKTNEEARAHFQGTFEPWMTWNNYGKYEKSTSYKKKWNIGHRIAKCKYDASNHDDLLRCWSADNLFAQCAKENHENNKKIVLSEQELLKLRHVWPLGVEDDLAKLLLILN